MDRAKFYGVIRAADSGLFGGSLNQRQVDGMESVLNAFVDYGDDNPKTLAYALATAYHETGSRMVPVREGFAASDAQARAITAHCRYGKPGSGGHVYYGRGHVQLTWEKNYGVTGEKLGIDLVNDPDMMLEPQLSARVLIEGLIDGRWNGRGKGIGQYLPKDGADDLRNARRTVNVLDKWSVIAGYYRSFLQAIDVAGGIPGDIVEAERVATAKPPEPSAAPPGETDEILLHHLEKSSAGGQDGKLTPINAWLGETLGRPLDGRKTASGIIGLVATAIIPVLFPETGDAILKAFDLGASDGQEVAAKGSLLLTTMFGALAGWGVLGKFEKWVVELSRR